MTERCENCIYCFKLKEFNEKWDNKSVCIVLPMTEDNDYKNFAMIVNKEHDMCEMWSERK